MSNLVQKQSSALVDHDFTTEQLELIKSTVAKGATDNELRLFLYRCKNMGLDPLKPGMVHFVKYGSNPGSIVVGIDGFRARAAASGKLAGVKRGVVRDEKGKCIAAWCEVYRSDWQHAAREEVSLAEYNTGKAMWLKMPETMLKKVAEAAALRMAFPDDLGGVYSDEETDQASGRSPSSHKADHVNSLLSAPTEISDLEIEPIQEPEIVEMTNAESVPAQASLGDYVIPISQKHKGKKLSELTPDVLKSFADWVDEKIERKNAQTVEFLENARRYLEESF